MRQLNGRKGMGKGDNLDHNNNGFEGAGRKRRHVHYPSM